VCADLPIFTSPTCPAGRVFRPEAQRNRIICSSVADCQRQCCMVPDSSCERFWANPGCKANEIQNSAASGATACAPAECATKCCLPKPVRMQIQSHSFNLVALKPWLCSGSFKVPGPVPNAVQQESVPLRPGSQTSIGG